MSKRTIFRILSFSIAITLVSLGFCVKFSKENERYMTAVQNSYSFAFEELNSAVNNISTILQKTRFATTAGQISTMATDLLTEAELSKKSLAELPFNSKPDSLNKFFSQVGNYAVSISKTLMAEGVISEQDTANIEKLCETAEKVAEIVNQSRFSYNNPEFWAIQIENELNGVVNNSGLDNAISDLENQLKDYPTLIYDGPYSDHLLSKEPTLLTNEPEINKVSAKLTAEKWAGKDDMALKFSQETSGEIPTYIFSDDTVTVGVTIKGGKVIYMRKIRNIKDTILSYEQSLDKAKRYLESVGMDYFRETYYYESDGICTINFAFVDGRTICYTDLIKVGVAMDTGEIVFYEAGGYISNHRERTFETPKYSEEDARKLISRKLEIKDICLALIPTTAEEEKRCYEFTCVSADGKDVLVYINTATLKEEDILILLKSDGGILVK